MTRFIGGRKNLVVGYFDVNSPKNSQIYSDFTRPKLCDTPNHGPAYLTLHVVTITSGQR